MGSTTLSTGTDNWGKVRAFIEGHRTVLRLVLVAVAMAALCFTIFSDWPLRFSTFAGSDLKTLYASVWCFAHGQNAYSFANLQTVFQANSVVLPDSWFGHAPVYPPPTLAWLLPFALLPMTTAVFTFSVISAALLALAVAEILRYADDEFQLGLGWQAAILIVCMGTPLVAFALALGNVSIVVSSLSILAFVDRRSGKAWLLAAGLAVALLLKPHLALWVLVSMFLLPDKAARRIAVRAGGLVAAFVVLVAVGLAVTGQFALQVHGYTAMLRAELAAGSSMSPTSHEVLPVVSQITSVASLLGFWSGHSAVTVLAGRLILLGLLILVVWMTRTVRTEAGACLAIGSWAAFGMLATYHRAHDAIFLLVLLPWMVMEVRGRPRSWYPWVAFVAYGAMALGPGFEAAKGLVSRTPYHSLLSFLLLRQAAMADFCLLLVLLAAMWAARARYTENSAFSRRSEPL